MTVRESRHKRQGRAGQGCSCSRWQFRPLTPAATRFFFPAPQESNGAPANGHADAAVKVTPAQLKQQQRQQPANGNGKAGGGRALRSGRTLPN